MTQQQQQQLVEKAISIINHSFYHEIARNSHLHKWPGIILEVSLPTVICRHAYTHTSHMTSLVMLIELLRFYEFLPIQWGYQPDWRSFNTFQLEPIQYVTLLDSLKNYLVKIDSAPYSYSIIIYERLSQPIPKSIPFAKSTNLNSWGIPFAFKNKKIARTGWDNRLPYSFRDILSPGK
jgi:hypothetical protein